jgi:hypothetical protein
MKEQTQQIELRSEKVRKIIGQVPPVMLRYGILIIGLALCVLVGVTAIIPYQPVIHSNLEIKQDETGQLYFTMNIRKKELKRKEQFAGVECKRASELSLPFHYQIHTILDTLLLEKEDAWYQVVLIPTESVLPNVKLNDNPLTLPAEILMKKKSLLMWMLDKKNEQ